MTRSIFPSLTQAAIVAALATAVPSQTVRTVTGSGTALANAVAQANPGDVLLVQSPGPFLPFHLDKGLTITGTPYTIQPTQSHPVRDLTVAVPPGQTATIRHCLFRTGRWTETLEQNFGVVSIQTGQVHIEDCDFRSRSAGLTIEAGAVASLARSTFTGGYPHAFGSPGGEGLVVDGTAVATDLTLQGYDASWPVVTPAPGLRVRGRFHGQRVVATGGSGAGQYDGQAGVEAAGAVWLVDCGLHGGARPLNVIYGGHAVLITGSVTAQLKRCTLTGESQRRPLVSGPVDLNAPLLAALANPSTPQIGQPLAITMHARPTELLAVFVTDRLAPSTVPWSAQPVWLAPTAFSLFVGGGVADPSGMLTIQLGVPNQPSLRGWSLWCLTVGAGSVPLQLGPPVGGTIE
ncbi:MAG: hypothetical protein R3F56_00215 [Planctomycetota bacterium]